MAVEVKKNRFAVVGRGIAGLCTSLHLKNAFPCADVVCFYAEDTAKEASRVASGVCSVRGFQHTIHRSSAEKIKSLSYLNNWNHWVLDQSKNSPTPFFTQGVFEPFFSHDDYENIVRKAFRSEREDSHLIYIDPVNEDTNSPSFFCPKYEQTPRKVSRFNVNRELQRFLQQLNLKYTFYYPGDISYRVEPYLDQLLAVAMQKGVFFIPSEVLSLSFEHSNATGSFVRLKAEGEGNAYSFDRVIWCGGYAGWKGFCSLLKADPRLSLDFFDRTHLLSNRLLKSEPVEQSWGEVLVGAFNSDLSLSSDVALIGDKFSAHIQNDGAFRVGSSTIQSGYSGSGPFSNAVDKVWTERLKEKRDQLLANTNKYLDQNISLGYTFKSGDRLRSKFPWVSGYSVPMKSEDLLLINSAYHKSGYLQAPYLSKLLVDQLKIELCGKN